MKKILMICYICFLFTIFVGCNDSINQYKITFNSNGGTEIASIVQDYNTEVTKPDDPTKTGYTFGGWYSDSDLTQEYTFTTMPGINIILYAKWLIISNEGLIYTAFKNNTCSVSGYNGLNSNVLIPSDLNECLVTKIGFSAFYNIRLTSITIPNSVTTIEAYAFFNATSLTTVIFEEGSQLTRIGNSAFLGVKSLTSITIPNSVKTIGNSTFRGATNLTTVIFEEGSELNTIGNSAFESTSLTTVTIPNSVTKIGDNVFKGTTSLVSINVDVDNPIFSSNNGVLLNKNQTTIILYPRDKYDATYTIPKSVITIGDSAFLGVKNLTKVVFEEGSQLTKIGKYAFLGTKNLTSVIIPNSVTTIEGDAFSGARNLTTIIFEEDSKLTTIGEDAFESTSLTAVTIPNSVTTIGHRAFGATDLTTVIFEEDSQLTTIGVGAFALTDLTSITIPKRVATIRDSAFMGASCLTSINVDADNPLFSSKDGVLFNKDQLTIIYYPEGKKDAIYTIPDNVTIIGSYAFKRAKNIKSINVDAGNLMFSSKDGVLFNKDQTTIIAYPAGKKEVTYTIPDSVTTIDFYAFSEATSLTNITIPNSVTTIGKDPFIGATNLTSIIINSTTPPSKNGLGYLNYSIKIYVPSDCVDIYKIKWPFHAYCIYPLSEYTG